MSWNNVLPWWVLVMESNFFLAKQSGAMYNEIHISDFRGDYFY